MKKIFLTTSFFFFTLLLSAQKKSNPLPKFGDISLDDLKMTVYAKDSSAEAVVLYDIGKTSFTVQSGNIQMVQEVHEQIKILKPSALERGSFSLQYYDASSQLQEYFTDIKGFTHNFNNGSPTKDKLTKEMIFNEKISENQKITKISMPNVKVGSIIEYTYTKHTPLNVRLNPDTWYFQQNIPVALSDYKITIPAYFYYRMLMNGFLSLYINDTEQVNISQFNVFGTEYHFALKDAPAFRKEKFITMSGDYVSKIDFELASVNWPNVLIKDFSLDYNSLNKTLLEDPTVGQQISKRGFLKDIAKEITTKYSDSTERISAAVSYITKNVKWNEKESFYCTNLKKVLEAKTGDAGDINLLLIALLREIGFDANPVILSTRDNGRIHEVYALLKRFNYVVAHIDANGKDLLIDATDENLKIGTLPYNCLNHRGWLIHPTNARFVSLEPTEKDSEFESVNLKLNADGGLVGSYTKSYAGYSASSVRKLLKKEGEEKFIEEIKKGKPNWTINKLIFNNQTDINKAFEAKYELEMTDYLTVAGNMLYLKPMLSEGHSENPFKEEERNFPVDFATPIEESFLGKFEIPEGYSVAEIPKSASVSLPDNGGKFIYFVKIDNNIINVSSRIMFRKSLYTPEEYFYLKEFYNQIVKKHEEQIILKKN